MILKMCVEELCQSYRGEGSNVHFLIHSYQCLQMSDDPFSKVSVYVERKEQPKMAAAYWQEWSGWKTSEGVRN